MATVVEWRDVIGYEGTYEVSSEGEIYSVPRRNTKGGILRPRTDSSGYLCLMLWQNGASKSASVHRLVAEAFIPNPKRLPQVNHKNGIKADNRVENLEWVTKEQNMQHAYDLGLKKAIKHPVIAVNQKTGETTEYESICGAGKELGLNHGSISTAIKKNYLVGNYKFYRKEAI